MGVHHPYRLDLCTDVEDLSQWIIRPGWDAPHVRCLPRTFCAWPCLLRQVGTVLGSPCDCIVTGITYANPGSRHGVRCRQLVVRLTAKHFPGPTWQQFSRGCAPADGKAFPSALGRLTAIRFPFVVRLPSG